MNKKSVMWVGVLLIIVLFSYLAWYAMENKSSEKLLMSGHPQWAPIMYQDNERIVGAGPEIAGMVFDKLGIKSESKYAGAWDEVQNKAKSGDIDVIVAAYKTDEREAYMDYSIPYTVDPVALTVKKGESFSYDKWSDLIGKKGVVTVGDSYGQGFDDYITNSLSVEQVATPQEAFTLLDNGGADYFVYALYSTEDYLYQNKLADQFEILPTPVSAENFYFTFSKKSPYLDRLSDFNTELQKMIDDGTVNRIIEKHKKLLWSEEK